LRGDKGALNRDIRMDKISKKGRQFKLGRRRRAFEYEERKVLFNLVVA